MNALVSKGILIFLNPHYFFLHFCSMNICIASSTEKELQELRCLTGNKDVGLHYLVHGVGIMNSLCSIQQFLLHHSCDLFIQCGVAGSYSELYKPGDVVFVKRDQFECGAEENDGTILTLSDLNLDSPNPLINPSSFPLSLPEVSALTVSVCSGTTESISRRIGKYRADIESMEGAACHYLALLTGTAFYQIRGISNRVEPRNREAWRVNDAIDACSAVITQFLKSL